MSIEVPRQLARIIGGQNARPASGRNRYDEAADAILSDPQVISRIVSELVPGLTGLTPDEVERECLASDTHARDEPAALADRAIMRVARRRGAGKTLAEGSAPFDVPAAPRQPSGGGAATVGLSLGGRETDCPVPSGERRAPYHIARLPSIRGEDLAAAERHEPVQRVASVWVIVEPHGADRAAVTHAPLGTEDTDLLDIIYVRLNTTTPAHLGTWSVCLRCRPPACPAPAKRRVALRMSAVWK